MASHFDKNRFFLKDTIRQQIDFRTTEQARGVPPPPLEKPPPPGSEHISLPGSDAIRKHGRISLGNAIAKRASVREFKAAPLSLSELAFLLWATQGVREVLSPVCALRTVPSAGARHAFETYLAVSNVRNLAPGIYRYLPLEHALVREQTVENLPARASAACLGQRFVAGAAVVFFWTAVARRMEWRYDLAAHKVIAIDAGHVCQNLYLACQAIGAGTCAIAAYDQDKADELLSVDGDDEFTVYIAPVGKT